MYGSNPYAQGGWHNPQNPQSINGPSWSTPAINQPSVFGALPLIDATASQPQLLTFNLQTSSGRQDILNCSLYGPTGKPYLEITTEVGSVSTAVTYFRKSDGSTLACIEWLPQARVSISGILSKNPVARWLELTPDKRRRTMFSGNRPYTWVPQDNQLLLYPIGSVMHDPLARISRHNGAVQLKLTADACAAGLLESAIVATVVLQSGRNID